MNFRPHQSVIDSKAEREGYEPGISIQRVEEIRMCNLTSRRGCGAQEARYHGRNGDYERYYRPDIESV